MEDLFETDKTSNARHIFNIFRSEELDKDSTSAVFALIQKKTEYSINNLIIA
jgi:hypothetical protein